MPFGNKVTDYAQAAIGYFGYTLKVDVTAILMHNIKSVQAQKDPNDTFAPVTGEVTIETIQGYLNSVDCPRLAFNFSDGQVTMFFRGTGAAIPQWAATTAYAVGDVIRNLADNDKLFKCTVAGESAASEPSTWSTTGNTTDGTVTWQYVSTIPIPDSFDYVAATRFALFGTRKAQDATVDGDTLDFPDKDLQLVLDYTKQLAWQTVKNNIPRDLKDSIKVEESRVRQD